MTIRTPKLEPNQPRYLAIVDALAEDTAEARDDDETGALDQLFASL